MTRRALIALPAFAVEESIDSCELEAVALWNKYASTADRYLKLRQNGIRSARERARMEEQFAAVMKSPCF